MMDVRYAAKNLMLVNRNKEWLQSGLKTSVKMSYYPAIIGGVSRSFSSNRYVKYLGKKFYYDNPATPLNLQNYPYEISHKILQYVEAKPKSVLDIGGNIGQFGCTLSHMLGHQSEIDVFEPNPQVFDYLQKNTSCYPGVRIFNYGIGTDAGHIPFFFEPNRSATGSMIKENASHASDNVKEVRVEVTNKPAAITNRKAYDLIKIDVEGFEHNVIKTLKGISAKWLFVEASSGGRKKDYDHSSLFASIERAFGSFDIYYASPVHSTANTFDMLLKFGSASAAPAEAE